jgi:hypothetical protein
LDGITSNSMVLSGRFHPVPLESTLYSTNILIWGATAGMCMVRGTAMQERLVVRHGWDEVGILAAFKRRDF